jgi:hypothetical protein
LLPCQVVGLASFRFEKGEAGAVARGDGLKGGEEVALDGLADGFLDGDTAFGAVDGELAAEVFGDAGVEGGEDWCGHTCFHNSILACLVASRRRDNYLTGAGV